VSDVNDNVTIIDNGASNNPRRNTHAVKLRVSHILLSVLIAPAGIVAGLYHMGNDSSERRAVGKAMLVISLASAVVAVACFCWLYMALINYFPFDML